MKNKKRSTISFLLFKKSTSIKTNFFAKNLNGENEEFNLDNLEIHSKSGQGSKTSVESIKDIKDNKICNYISGRIFEEEVIKYLRSKLNDFYFEIPNIFYDNKITLNRGIVRINCIYNNDKNEYFDYNDMEIFEIPPKSLLFIEVKKTPNYEGDFIDLFLKINKYENLINDIYKTSGYKILILYFYNNLFISSKDYFEHFKKGINNSLKLKGGNYSVYSFYIYDNIYLYNKLEGQKRLEKVEHQLVQTTNKLNETEKQLTQTKIELVQTKDKLKKNIIVQKETNASLNNVENILVFLFNDIYKANADINTILNKFNRNPNEENINNNKREVSNNSIINQFKINPNIQNDNNSIK